MKQLDGGTQLRICPECHVGTLYLLPEHKDHVGYKCPTCGFTILKRRKPQNEDQESQ